MRLRRVCLGAGRLTLFVLLGLATNEAVALSYTSLLKFHEEAAEEDFTGFPL